MAYMRVKISTADKELIVNPNCPIKLLYNFIQTELVAANTKKLFSESKVALAGSMSAAYIPNKEESTSKGLLRRRSSSKSSTGNRSISKILSATKQDMSPDQEYDLVDEKGNLLQIYSYDPWINGWEAGIFIERATYYVVTFDRDDKGSMTNLQIMASKSSKNYIDMMTRIRRQSRVFSKQKHSEEMKTLKEGSLKRITSLTR